MILKFYSFVLLGALTMGFLSGCTTVESWDRNILAKENMTMIPDPLGSAWRDHAEFSREGTEGATGTGGGGCGCN